MPNTLIINALVVPPEGEPALSSIRIEGPRIRAIGPDIQPAPGDTVIDAAGAIAAPGLIDIHIHGSGGHWGFLSADDLVAMSQSLIRNGVTSFCPATVSLPHKDLLNAIRVIREAMTRQSAGTNFDAPPAQNEGARILGINLEGPYISPEKPGAHNPLVIREPKDEEVGQLLDAAAGAIRVATVAPEIKGGLRLIKQLADLGVLVSIGHSNATAEQLNQAVHAGARLLTHLFNAMRLFHQREPGVAFAGLLHTDIAAEIIADGHHMHPDSANIAARLAGPQRIILVTDAIAAAGMPDGQYSLWGFTVDVKDGKSLLPNGTLAGSVLTLNRGVANFSQFSGWSLSQSIRCATANPAKLLRLESQIGALAPGNAADIALFDPQMNCTATFIGGKRVYEK